MKKVLMQSGKLYIQVSKIIVFALFSLQHIAEINSSLYNKIISYT